jgi:uncharacterized damage-inducible protein DinB
MGGMAVEPWLRGTLGEVDPVRRAVLHALELAGEDVARWCDGLSDEQMFARPAGLPPVAFQLRHMARSLDRLLTYAETGALSEAQMAGLKTEMDGAGSAAEVLAEFREGLQQAMERVRAIGPERFAEARGVGRKLLPTTVAGLLIHCADHTQRHVGQMVTTAKVVAAHSSHDEAVR